ncbi:hypothetical protein D9611_013621 [Ephemerocybe angulata]|uniref:Lon N-terminal domain-containing protein n=1 Tax=Ephemerocybe angulata TaxID=980116 RepID=A0A8H5ASK0_9AGAR|nr:hypothetical protein D9611_013621 [Tulosesus angulatus]
MRRREDTVPFLRPGDVEIRAATASGGGGAGKRWQMDVEKRDRIDRRGCFPVFPQHRSRAQPQSNLSFGGPGPRLPSLPSFPPPSLPRSLPRVQRLLISAEFAIVFARGFYVFVLPSLQVVHADWRSAARPEPSSPIHYPLFHLLRTSYPRWINSKTGQDDADGSVPVSEDGAKNESELQKEGESEEPVKETETPKSSEEASSALESSPSEGAPAPPSSSSTPPASNTDSDSVIKPTIPSSYLYTLLSLTIARRPLFPGFYKAVVIRNPAVVAAIKEILKRGQPYLGAFLLKEKENKDMESTEEDDKDIIDGLDESILTGKSAVLQEEALTAVLYPHRRIRITELVQPGTAIVKVDEADITEALSTPPAEPVEGTEETTASSPTSFLKEYPISLVRITNLPTEPYTKDNQHIRAFTSEIITNFSINQVTSTNIFDEPDKLADLAAAVSSGEPQELQDVLESTQVEDRLRRALLVLKKELINAELQSKLARDVAGTLTVRLRQREYYFMEHELGLEGSPSLLLLGVSSSIVARRAEGRHSVPPVAEAVYTTTSILRE